MEFVYKAIEYKCSATSVFKNLRFLPHLLMLYKAHVKDEKPTFHSNIATIYTTIAVERVKKKQMTKPHRWLSGKLWYLQHSCVGDTIVYHSASDMVYVCM